MASERVRIEVTGNVSSSGPLREGCMHIVSVHMYGEIEEYLEEESGRVRMMGSYPAPPPPISHIVLKPVNFTPRHVRQLLHLPFLDASLSHFLTQKIIDIAEQSHASVQRPLYISVFVKFTKQILLLPIPTVTAFAPIDVFQRLAEEQTVQSCQFPDEEEACSICLENLSGSEAVHQAVIQMPGCLHMFHQDCIFEWLRQQNSCPLCRRVPYDVDDEE